MFDIKFFQFLKYKFLSTLVLRLKLLYLQLSSDNQLYSESVGSRNLIYLSCN